MGPFLDITYASRAGTLLGEISPSQKPGADFLDDGFPPGAPDVPRARPRLISPQSTFYEDTEDLPDDRPAKPDRATHELYLEEDVQNKPKNLEMSVELKRRGAFGLDSLAGRRVIRADLGEAVPRRSTSEGRYGVTL
ncbi:unnamed protein product [Effrenium voratum]|uniref:Uncharacterized protein n=1 Tax=Effrenium voratum TaxID=2562239 RepID=A0AA36JGN0_9DINO|nr:unnamed protein product [Effrenium voratum]